MPLESTGDLAGGTNEGDIIQNVYPSSASEVPATAAASALAAKVEWLKNPWVILGLVAVAIGVYLYLTRKKGAA